MESIRIPFGELKNVSSVNMAGGLFISSLVNPIQPVVIAKFKGKPGTLQTFGKIGSKDGSQFEVLDQDGKSKTVTSFNFNLSYFVGKLVELSGREILNANGDWNLDGLEITISDGELSARGVQQAQQAQSTPAGF